MDALIDQIFRIESDSNFNQLAMKVFDYQVKNNILYQEFIHYLGIDINKIQDYLDIPFLPISFFKSHQIITKNNKAEEVFLSSGTTGMEQSKHYVSELKVYEQSFLQCFQQFYGAIESYTILALLPNYLERKGSSLVYMVDQLMARTPSNFSGFYLHNLDALAETLKKLDERGEKVLLIGVSYALLDLIEQYQFQLKHTIVMETGGMKGQRKEMVKEELHDVLCQGFGVKYIHSEYGMTELLSQAYSHGNGIFNTPPWLKILTRDPEDPLQRLPHNKVGGINIIDLANIYSCPFIATQDLGKTHSNHTFEVLGRFDNSDIRGCNLMVV